MALHFTTSYLEDALELFHQSKKLAEQAMEQVSTSSCLLLST
jgi:hypothetical protein